MARVISDDVLISTRDLIRHITGLEENSKRFEKHENYILNEFKRADTMYFLNTKDMDREIGNMAQKFEFHGFFRHADNLKSAYEQYIKAASKSELSARLNTIKFLLCMSHSPTNKFWDYPEKFKFVEKKVDEEDINWGEYLKEGIERWSPFEEDSNDSSDVESDIEQDLIHNETKRQQNLAKIIKETPKTNYVEFHSSRSQLIETVQNDWFNQEKICMLPPSDWPEANLALHWQQHLAEQSGGLVEVKSVNIITEYKVMREIMWQFFGIHSSAVFRIEGNKIKPQSLITISSVRQPAFYSFLNTFIPYIEMVEDFREYFNSLTPKNPDRIIPQTYLGYSQGIRNILAPTMDQLIEIEEEIRQQETMTLLGLANKLKDIFQPIKILTQLHKELIEDLNCNTPLNASLTLLNKLRRKLNFHSNKMEQDIALSLYLETIKYYLRIIDGWLVKNDFYDYTKEFLIINKNLHGERYIEPVNSDWRLNYELQCTDIEINKNDILGIISNDVLQIGRNVHLLRILGKSKVINRSNEQIYEEFIRKIIEELQKYYCCVDSEEELEEKSNILKDECDELSVSHFSDASSENLSEFVDTSDGFLMKAFSDSLLEPPPSMKITKYSFQGAPSIYQRIKEITTNLYPLQDLPETVLSQILNERFRISGLVVKNLLIEDYNLEKLFDFMRHIYLFHDDLIFPFSRRLFTKMATNHTNWGNGVWLTSHLQDVIMDMYPNFYSECRVQVKDNWKQWNDLFEMCSLINVDFEVKWPSSMIITENHLLLYKEIFSFLLKIKWTLFTLNHLTFTDLEPRQKSTKSCNRLSNVRKIMVTRLYSLRFFLLNVLNSIQHYIFGFVFTERWQKFQLDFEKANDLESIMEAHSLYINTIYEELKKLSDTKSDKFGFSALITAVKLLRTMWNNPETATLDNLQDCFQIYQKSFQAITPIISPTYLFID